MNTSNLIIPFFFLFQLFIAASRIKATVSFTAKQFNKSCGSIIDASKTKDLPKVKRILKMYRWAAKQYMYEILAMNALICAARVDDVELAKFLITEAGVRADSYNEIALKSAKRAGSSGVVELLSTTKEDSGSNRVDE